MRFQPTPPSIGHSSILNLAVIQTTASFCHLSSFGSQSHFNQMKMGKSSNWKMQKSNEFQLVFWFDFGLMLVLNAECRDLRFGQLTHSHLDQVSRFWPSEIVLRLFPFPLLVNLHISFIYSVFFMLLLMLMLLLLLL